MLTFVAPLIAYILSFPVMLVSLFRVEIGMIYFVSLIPFIAVMMKIRQFPMGHNVADFLLIAMIVGWILKGGRKSGGFLISSPANWAVSLLVLGSVISLLRGYGFPGLGSEINLARLIAWKNFMILPAIYLLSANNLGDRRFVRWLLVVVCLAMIGMDFNFYSTFRWVRSFHYSHDIRIAGPFSFLGPNEMGVFFSMYTFLLIGLSYHVEDKYLRYLLWFTCLCNGYSIMYSYSRAAYLSALAGALTLGIVRDRRILLALILAVSFYSFILPNSVVERINMTFLNSEETAYDEDEVSSLEVGGVAMDTVGRAELWDRAIAYFQDNMLLGIGFDTFRHLEGMITHSMYMRIIAEQGLVGAFVYLVFVVTMLVQSFKLYRKGGEGLRRGIGLGFFTCLIVHLFGSITGDQSLYYNLMTIYWMGMGLMARMNWEVKQEESASLEEWRHA